MSRLVTQLTTRHQTPATHLEAVRERDPEPPLPITPPSQGSPSDRGGQPHRLQKWEFIIARCREKLGYVLGQQGNNSSYVWKYQYRTAMKSSIYHINHSVWTDVLYFASRPPHTPHTPKRWLSTLICHGIPDQVGEVSILVVNKCGDTVFNAMLPREVHCDQSRAAKLPTVRYVS